jgi:hypothetical protein
MCKDVLPEFFQFSVHRATSGETRRQCEDDIQLMLSKLLTGESTLLAGRGAFRGSPRLGRA